MQLSIEKRVIWAKVKPRLKKLLVSLLVLMVGRRLQAAAHTVP